MVREFEEVMQMLWRPTKMSGLWYSTARSTTTSSITPISWQGWKNDLDASWSDGLTAMAGLLVRLTRLPVVSIALIRGRATGNGSEIALACDMSFVSREKAILSQWEVGVGGRPVAPHGRLPQLIGRNRALEVLMSSEDIGVTKPRPTDTLTARCQMPS